VRKALAAAAVTAVLAGCGGPGTASPVDVVRSWSEALNRSDDAAAASLFAPNAIVVQGGTEFRLGSPAEARRWNAGLPCAGKIVALKTKGATVTATFLLGHRPHHRCDGPGATATAIFRVEAGKIVLWHQTGSQPAGPVV
jgi:limonene-1,2-epoxide hydrolase